MHHHLNLLLNQNKSVEWQSAPLLGEILGVVIVGDVFWIYTRLNQTMSHRRSLVTTVQTIKSSGDIVAGSSVTVFEEEILN